MSNSEQQRPDVHQHDSTLDLNLVQRIEQLLIEDYEHNHIKQDSRFFPNNANHSKPIQQADHQHINKQDHSYHHDQQQTTQHCIEQILTNGQILQQVLQDQNVCQMVQTNLSSQDISSPILYLDVISLDNQEFDLDQDDIYEVINQSIYYLINQYIIQSISQQWQTFVRFGRILHLTIKSKRAFIFYENLVSAFFAKRCNNDFYIDELNVKMKLEFIDLETNLFQDYELITTINKVYNKQIAIPKPKHQKGEDNQQNNQENDNQHNNTNINILSYQNINQNYYQKQPDHLKFNTHTHLKYTCKYEILIEPDKQFQVARKIIGSKGINMKKIIEKCNQTNQSKDQDTVKLRLRGKGSGYKEGPNKKESSENLHLCVSSKYSEYYQLACQLVEELLDLIYNEYIKHLKKKNIANYLKKSYQKVESQQNPRILKNTNTKYTNQ